MLKCFLLDLYGGAQGETTLCPSMTWQIQQKTMSKTMQFAESKKITTGFLTFYTGDTKLYLLNCWNVTGNAGLTNSVMAYLYCMMQYR